MKINNHGIDYEVEVMKTKYINGNLAVLLIDSKDGQPYGNLTINLGDKLDDNEAYVDVNNMPDAERFIIDNRLGERTNMIKPSGFCVYPLYKFY